jgi:ABC-type phosphate/phosphonate transport system permease subunit
MAPPWAWCCCGRRWCSANSNPGCCSTLQSLVAAGRFLAGFLTARHTAEFLAMVLRETWQTVAIATAGLTLALLGAIPATLMVTERLSISRLGTGRMRLGGQFAAPAVRWLLVLLRSVPELVWALLFVRVVGLGPTAGVLAIALTYSGMLGKVYAEILESSDAHATDALLANGAAPGRAAVRRAARIGVRTGLVHRVPLGVRDPRFGRDGLCRRRRPWPAHG